jgi:hypothetical protein
MNVPWTTILLHAPTIVEAARKLLATARRPIGETEADDDVAGGRESLRGAVAALTERQAEQAALLADLAGQVQAMAVALEELRRRTMLALVGAALAGVVALASAALVWWRVG